MSCKLVYFSFIGSAALILCLSAQRRFRRQTMRFCDCFVLPFFGVFLRKLANDYGILIIKDMNVLKLRKLTAL